MADKENKQKNKSNIAKNSNKKGNHKKSKKKKNMFKDRRLNIIVGKIGLTEQDANWCIKLHKKYCIWIANQIKDNPNIKNREGDILMILDWKKEIQDVNLNDFTFDTALQEARKLHGIMFKENNNSLKNKNVVLDLGNYKWVQLLTQEDCQEEGNAMGHCVGGHSGIWREKSYAFSLRDEFNRPHLTLEARRENGVIFEFKGRNNGVPKAEYLQCYIELARKFSTILGTITDYTFTETITKNIVIAQQLNEANPKALDENLKLKLGLNLFKEGQTFMNSIQTEGAKTFKIPKELKIYGNLQVSLIGGKMEIPNDIIIGGSVTIRGTSIKLGDGIKIGGNLNLSKSNVTNIPNNLQVCGDVILPQSMKAKTKEIESKVTFGGRLIFFEEK